MFHINYEIKNKIVGIGIKLYRGDFELLDLSAQMDYTILNIQTSFKNIKSNEYYENYVFIITTHPYNKFIDEDYNIYHNGYLYKQYTVCKYNNETDMLIAWYKFVRKMNPDSIIPYYKCPSIQYIYEKLVKYILKTFNLLKKLINKLNNIFVYNNATK